MTKSRDWGANTSFFFLSSTKFLCSFSGCREIALHQKKGPGVFFFLAISKENI